jgi:cytochrome c peroxidase
MASRKSKRKSIKHVVIVALTMLLFTQLSGWSQNNQISDWQKQLGEQLFREARFSAPQGDLPASCANCHLFDEDPQGLRPFADFFNRSWISYRKESPQRFELRNSPALFDVAAQPHLHYDGEFASLEDLVKGTFAGRPLGWLPGEEPQAFAQLQKVVVTDTRYREEFKKAYQLDLAKLSRAAVVNAVARAVTDFMRTLKSQMNSPYDQFVRVNNLDTKPALDESAQAFGQRFLAKVITLEQTQTLKLPQGFTPAALEGLKVFFNPATGNCVTCHAPPLFTDFSYHNLGISQVEYDQVHGAGKFALLAIPDAAQALRPTQQFREYPTKAKPHEVDLGHWNYVDLKISRLRRTGENDDQFLRRMIGTVKTPGLRHLAYTYPYMHNGAYLSLEDSLNELQRLSEMARVGEVREADDELKKIRMRATDVAALITFLQTLNEDLKAR